MAVARKRVGEPHFFIPDFHEKLLEFGGKFLDFFWKILGFRADKSE